MSNKRNSPTVPGSTVKNSFYSPSEEYRRDQLPNIWILILGIILSTLMNHLKSSTNPHNDTPYV